MPVEPAMHNISHLLYEEHGKLSIVSNMSSWRYPIGLVAMISADWFNNIIHISVLQLLHTGNRENRKKEEEKRERKKKKKKKKKKGEGGGGGRKKEEREKKEKQAHTHKSCFP